MKALIFLGLFLVSRPATASDLPPDFKIVDYHRTPKTFYIVRQILNQYPQERLLHHLREFVQCCRPQRILGSEAHQQAQNFLEERLKAISGEGVTVSKESFAPDWNKARTHYGEGLKNLSEQDPSYERAKTFTQSRLSYLAQLEKKQFQGANFIWEKKGALDSNELLILGTHYDGLGIDAETWALKPDMLAPGADANGSGVATLLAIAEVLNEIELPRTIRLVFFDAHEFSALGANAYVNKHYAELKERGGVFVNVMMLGHDSKREDKSGAEGNMRAYIREAQELEKSPDYQHVIDFLKRGRESGPGVRFDLVARALTHSNQTPFWEADIPAVVMTQNWEEDFNGERHHTSNDFVETLNFKTLSASFRHIAGAAISWAYQFSLP